jgi:hypothetical protein
MAYYSMQRKKLAEKLKALEKDIFKEFNIKGE